MAALVVGLVVAAVAVLRFGGIFAGTAAQSAGASYAGRPHANNADPGNTRGAPSRRAAAIQAAAAAWIADQVSSDAMVACDPGMCAALEHRGVTPGRLVLLQHPGAARLLGPGVIVAALSIPIRLAREYAPALVASFGSDSARVDVRGTVPGGTAAYASALRADLAARMSAGSQLLQNGRITFTAQAAAQLRAGAVDSRLLVTLAAMSSQYSIRVTGFSDTSPGAHVLFRAAAIARGGRSAGTAGLTAALDMVNAQGPPYRPARAAIIHPATGSATLLIEFAAPSPLGLLTPVLTVHTQGAEAHTTVIAGTFPETGIAQMRGK